MAVDRSARAIADKDSCSAMGRSDLAGFQQLLCLVSVIFDAKRG